MTETTSPSPSTQEEYAEVMKTLFELMEGVMRGHVLRTGIELGLFEALESEARTVEELSRELGVDSEHAYRLLRALAYTDFVTEEPDRSFSRTPLGKYLEHDVPDSIGDGIRFWFHPKLEAAWSHLPEMIAEGPPDGFQREFGKSLWEYLEEDQDLSSQFHRFMSALRMRRTSVIADLLADYDFEPFSHICDVGGGHGHMMSHVLDAHPHLEGTVLDLPNAIAQEQHHWAPKLGVGDRCTYQAGDMFDGVPRADAYFLQGLLNGIPEEGCVDVLSNIHQSAPRGGRVFIIEPMAPESTEPDFAQLFDIQLMITTRGRSRTESEYRSILGQSNLEFVRSQSSDQAMFNMIEASNT